ncbi:MAG: hypothetical protein ACJ71K_02305 [Nitrososphaeraceae archaeon]
MSKTSNNNTYLRVSLVTITSLSMPFSTFHFQVQPANAQNSTNSTGILPPISQEQHNIALMITAVVVLVVTIAAIAVKSSAGNRPVNA